MEFEQRLKEILKGSNVELVKFETYLIEDKDVIRKICRGLACVEGKLWAFATTKITPEEVAKVVLKRNLVL